MYPLPSKRVNDRVIRVGDDKQKVEITQGNYGDLRPLIEDSTFTKMTLAIDAARYVRCTFRDCTIVYAGGELSLKECTFERVEFSLVGAAANTLNFLKGFGAEGSSFRPVVEALFQEILGG